ncbi:MAG: multiheme c-type cytochrome [Candidatus Krumholzibacteria bacterium]|nr:multiheme c-type cytochrome [Candidatus Krumholzibacteria bacterium]
MKFLRQALVVLVVTAIGGTTACTDTVTEYVNRPFNPPVDQLNGFLGYYDVAAHKTVCGNCHASTQGQWRSTKHSDAWATLQASGEAQAACEGCHTLSELGNSVSQSGGYTTTRDAAYQDVQCESCHGPGFEHVSLPDGGTAPLPSIAIPQDYTTATNGCAECHQGAGQPFADQWVESRHGYAGNTFPRERDPATNVCPQCHEGREAIRTKFNVTTKFVEQADPTNYQPIVCAVCHDPHSRANEGQLRAPLAEPSREQICVRCHSREGHPIPGTATRRGPHAAQGLLVIGEDAGWIPPGFSGDTANAIAGTHGTTANPRLCASCHVYMFDVTDPGTGAFVIRSVGHTFEAIGCLDPATGLPVGGDCALADRNFKGCAIAGCHSSEDAARAAFTTVRSRMNFLTDLLWTDTDADSVLEATDSGILPQVLAQAIAAGDSNQINLYDATFTPAEGAIWNAQLAYTHEREQWSNFRIAGQWSCATPAPGCATGSTNTAHKSSGEGVHNPFLLDALLTSSASYLIRHYGLPAPPVDLTPQMQQPASWVPVR